MRQILLIILVGCQFIFANASGENIRKPRILKIALGTNIASLNPMRQLDLISASVLSNIYDALFYSNGISSRAEPMLVESYKRLGEYTWRCSLRKNITFHNGEPLDAKAVKFSLDYQRDEDKSSWAGHLTFIKKIKVINKYTVDIITEHPIPNLAEILRYGYNYIMPPFYYKAVGEDGLGRRPVGTGPYIFAGETPSGILLKKNDHYWGEKPFFDLIEYKFIHDDKERINLLSRGDLDISTNINVHYLATGSLVMPTFNVIKVMTPRIVFMEFANGIKPRKHNNSLLDDVLFRQALNYAVDRKAIVKYVLMGNGSPAWSPVNPIFPAFDASTGYKYDPILSKTLLRKSNYASNQNHKIKIMTPSGRYPMDQQVTKAVVHYFNKIGVKTELKIYEDWQDYQNMLRGNTNEQVFIALLGFGVIEFKTMLDFYFGRDWERNRFKDQELMEAIQNLDNVGVGDKISNEKAIAKYLVDKSYIIPLFNVANIYGVRKGVEIEARDDEVVSARIVKKWTD